MLKNEDELKVYVSHRVSQPNQAPLQLEYVPNVSDNEVGEEHLNSINEGDASSPNFQPSTLKFSSNPPDETPPSNIPSKSFDPTIDEDPSNDDLEDNSELEGNTSRDSDVNSDVHQEYIDIRASKRYFNRSQRRSRGTTDVHVNVGEKSPDIGYDESNIGTRDSLVGKLGGEPYYLSDEAPSFEFSDEAGASTGRGRGRARGSCSSHTAGISYQQEPSRRVISSGAKVTKRSDIVTGDIGYTPRQGFKWKGKSAITNRNLERMRAKKAWAFEAIHYLRQQVNYHEKVSYPRILRRGSGSGSGSGVAIGANDAPLIVFEKTNYYDYDRTGYTDFVTFKRVFYVKMSRLWMLVESTTEHHNITVDNTSTTSKEEEKVESISSEEWKNYPFEGFNISDEAPKILTKLINDYSEWIADRLVKHHAGRLQESS
ncbi:hypothetical protein T459_19305 [Capsicum annuum]|uniref:Uncharacterized protein n=1 Tax=Capsicum annuum TaxID=4072 RepID=A0A2G2Z1C6_CAPAN|nr:hypothetical protein T459_19305 [Capsicum annuum]